MLYKYTPLLHGQSSKASEEDLLFFPVLFPSAWELTVLNVLLEYIACVQYWLTGVGRWLQKGWHYQLWLGKEGNKASEVGN